MICVSLTDTSPASLEAAALADMVELRLDHLGADGWRELAARLGKPVIVTYRRHDQGGAPAMRGVPEDERLRVLADAATSGQAAYVDVERGCAAAIPSARSAQLIVSEHDFTGMPEDLSALCRAIKAEGADVVKVAVTPADAIDTVAIYEAMRACRREGIEAVVLGMGEAGQATRVLGLRWAPWSYASVAAGGEVAPGQIPVREMIDLYRANSITEDGPVYGVIGDPIAHSLSPLMHNAAFLEAGFDTVRYLPFRVTGDPAAFVRAMQTIPVHGWSVTIPHKAAVMGALQRIDPLAERIGAVNTVVREEDGSLSGYNTDCRAAVAAVAHAAAGDPEDALTGRRAVVLGAGGAARAIVCGLADCGAHVTVANRTVEKARALADEFGCDAAGLDTAASGAFEILVNATSVGMHPHVDASPVPADALSDGMIVFDTVYNPLETRLLREARARGCRVIDGVSMFVGQGAEQFTLWTGRAAPIETMRRVTLEHLRRRQR